MEHDRITQQVLALAGVTQVARLVDQVSKTGEYPAEFLTPVINSLFAFDADSTAAIYGGVVNLKLGLHNLSALLANRDGPENQELVKYVFSMLYLERKFAANPQMQDIVHSRLEHAAVKSEHFSSHVNEVCQSLSGIYQDTLSTFKFRIKVSGSAQQLENPLNADIIRALLLAGIRSAYLWNQLGGRRWQLMFQRRKLLDRAQRLSRELGVV
ncbi:lysogenization regulator HflD [Halieaceae bacterium IMCC14734]|uniref:High frequency lysogenization protein HflD homolog n=1 Tax=Candidatus Litorirhabdus singularis TaxID=2518993 RepID=A0ABT3THG3_9GAMM|nr:lysogenization regulator HflD [Candidatus Litorirhabdus singularis]